MKQYYIVCDVSLCHDCNNCFIACKDEHVDNEWPPYTGAQPRHGHRWMDILRKERGQYPRIDVAYLPVPCQHCADAPCVRANPGCVSRRADGIVLIDPVKAKGNKALVGSCPYGAIFWNEGADVAQKCTMCAHILEGGCWEGNMPRCVHSCPTGALEFFQLEPAEMEEKAGAESLECYRPEFSGGKANVWYKNLHRFEKHFIAGGLLKDGECAEGVEVTLVCGSADSRDAIINNAEICNPTGSDTTTSGAIAVDSTVGETALCLPECHGETVSQQTDCFGDFKFDGLRPGEYTISVDGKAVRAVSLTESVNVGSIVLTHNA